MPVPRGAAPAPGSGAPGASNGAEQADAEVGYGLAKLAEAPTPCGGLSWTEGGAREHRLGARFRHGKVCLAKIPTAHMPPDGSGPPWRLR